MRVYRQINDDHGLLTPTLATAVRAATRWLGPLSSLYAQGSATLGHVSPLVEYGHRTALFSAELLGPGVGATQPRPNLSYLVIGNCGTLLFDSPGGDGLPVDLSPAADAATNEVAALVEQSLRQRRPVRATR